MSIDPELVLAGDLTVFARRFLVSQLVFFTRLHRTDRAAILRAFESASSEFRDVHRDLVLKEEELERLEATKKSRAVRRSRARKRRR